MTATALVIDEGCFPEETKEVFEINGEKQAFWPAEEFTSREFIEMIDSFPVGFLSPCVFREVEKKIWRIVYRRREGELCTRLIRFGSTDLIDQADSVYEVSETPAKVQELVNWAKTWGHLDH